MEIADIKKEKFTIVELSGRLDTTNYQELEKALQSMLDAEEKNIILDCEKLDYVSSSGLRVFLMFLKKIRELEGKFFICSMQEEIREVFKISGFTSIFDIFENREKAEAAM
ncbi:MAG: STAS domain-containing protein [Bacteroidota bacterium]|nr:STAS domain-containing protein [Bacteroidota bacterium]